MIDVKQGMANSTRANIEGLVADGLRLRSQANQGSQQPLREQENVAHDAAIDAAAGAPVRRRRKIKQDRQVTAYLAEYNDVEAHLQENEFIKRYYRKGYSFKRSFFSLFSLHNETGNIWTHLVGKSLSVVPLPPPFFATKNIFPLSLLI